MKSAPSYRPIAGTTRDLIEDEVSIEGIRFRFMDTAGLRDTTDQVEKHWRGAHPPARETGCILAISL